MSDRRIQTNPGRVVFPAVTEPTQPDQLFLERPRLTDLPCAMEHTVAVIKPDVCSAGAASRVVEIAEAAGFFVARRRELRFSPTLARQFYAHLESQPNFRVLVEFLSSGPVVALVLTKVGAVKAWRTLIGPMDPARAREIAPSSVRALLGADAVRNAVHGSDSDESARREANLLFPPGALEALVPKEYLVETVLPGLVDALGEMYASQPEDGYRWMSHWFQCSAPPPRDMLEDWPDAVLHGGAALVADANHLGEDGETRVVPTLALADRGKRLTWRSRDKQERAAPRGDEERAEGIGGNVLDVLELVEVRPDAIGELAKGKDGLVGNGREGHAETSERDESGADAIAQTDNGQRMENHAETVWDGRIGKTEE